MAVIIKTAQTTAAECPNEINNAVGLLEEAGFVTTQIAPETNPFSFYHAQLTQRGKLEIMRQTQQRFVCEADDNRTTERERVLLPTPAGSPFGFTDTDWEIVIEKKKIERNYLLCLDISLNQPIMTLRN